MLYTKVIRGLNVAKITKSGGRWYVDSVTPPPTGSDDSDPVDFREYAQFCQDVANILEALQSAKESN